MAGDRGSRAKERIQCSGLEPRPGCGDALNPAARHRPQRLSQSGSSSLKLPANRGSPPGAFPPGEGSRPAPCPAQACSLDALRAERIDRSALTQHPRSPRRTPAGYPALATILAAYAEQLSPPIPGVSLT